MRSIPLSKGFSALVDDRDFERVSQFKWHASLDDRGNRYAARCFRQNGNRFKILMHRFITRTVSTEIEVDHRNRDGLDNRRRNLRRCVPFQNRANSKRYKSNTSGFKGVHLLKRTGRFQAKCRKQHIGYFPTAADAARAYNRAAQRLFGRFARLNTIPAL